MNKPFSLIYEEFKQELINLINNSSLPPFVIVSVLQNYLYEVSTIAKNQYLSDKSQYKEFLLKKENINKNSNCTDFTDCTSD